MNDTTLPALDIEGLRKDYDDPEGGRTTVLSLDRLVIARGEATAIVGESGSGKTTLLHMVAGIVPADAGRIRIAGDEITGRSEATRDRLRAQHIGYLFQTFNLLGSLTALENVALGLGFRKRSASPRREAREALERVGLGHRLRYRPHQLSVGQQQRVAIARALAGQPTVVLADEPTSSLDAARAAACLDLLTGFADESGAALIVASHDPQVLSRIARHEHLPARVEVGA